MDRVLEWVAENPVYAGIIIAAAVIIIVLVILLIVRGVRKSKKQADSKQNAADENEAAPESPAVSDDTADETQAADAVLEEEPYSASGYSAPADEAPAALTEQPEPLPDETDTAAEESEQQPAPLPEAADEETQADAAPEETHAYTAADAEPADAEESAAPAAQEAAEESTAETAAPASEAREISPEENGGGSAQAKDSPAKQSSAKERQKTPKQKTAEPAEKKSASRSAKATAKQAEEPEKRNPYAGKWLIFKNEDKSCYFELRASNGEKLLRSLDYTSLSGAKAAIKTYKNNIAKGNLAIAQSKTGHFYFQLLSGSKQLLCTGGDVLDARRMRKRRRIGQTLCRDRRRHRRGRRARRIKIITTATAPPAMRRRRSFCAAPVRNGEARRGKNRYSYFLGRIFSLPPYTSATRAGY